MTIVATPGDPAADSYVTVAEADAYFLARGTATWTGSDAVKEAALRKGTTYLDNQYRGRWKGYRTNQLQSLSWPRVGSYRENGVRIGNSLAVDGIIDSDGFEIGTDVVPAQVKNATIEAALLSLTNVALEPRLERGGQIKSLSEQVGPLSTSTVWADGAPAVDRYLVIEGLLRGLVTSMPGASSGNVPLVRA